MVRKDLIQDFKDGKVNCIIHGCNCFCKMGAGIARAIKEEFPKAYEADMATLTNSEDNFYKLGKYSYCKVDQGYIFNAYTQFRYGTDRPHVEYTAISDSLRRIAGFIHETPELHNVKIGMPKIGCGLAGGDWSIVEGLVEDALGHLDTTVYYL